jgi:hypothetical protein
MQIDLNTGEEHKLRYPDARYPGARFNEKGCLQVWGGDALKALHVSIMFEAAPKNFEIVMMVLV